MSPLLWTTEEIAFLQENWTKMADAEIGKCLGKNRYTVKNKRLRLKLKRREPTLHPDWSLANKKLPHDFKVKPLDLDPLILGYLCGFIDADGSLTFTIATDRKHVIPVISIANNNREVLKWIKESVGLAKRSTSNKGKSKYANHPNYHCAIAGLIPLTSILLTITRHLRIKKRQAELMLEFCQSRIEKHKKASRPSYTSRELEIATQVRELNGYKINHEISWEG